MAIIRRKEIKQMSEKEIQNKINELKKQLMRINAQIAVGTTPESPGKVKTVKRTIAKLLTELKNKKKGGG
jgi:large subunit ribosomal protein L29